MAEQAASLMYAIRIPVVLKYAAQLALVQAGLILLPFCFALYYAEYDHALCFFAISTLLTLIALPFLRLPVSAHIQTNEAFVIIVITFLTGAAVMIYPFMRVGLPFLDALFEAVSGITTTGLSTLADVETKPKSFLFARAWMQWYGGLGFVVLAVALMIGQSANRRLLGQEIENKEIIVGIRNHARQVTLVYLLLTIFPLLLLYFGGVDGFTAIVHVLSAVSTGGFSSFNNSLAGLHSWPVEFILSCVGLSGAISLTLYYRFYQHDFSYTSSVSETFFLIFLLTVLTAILAIILPMAQPGNGLTSIRQALLLSISAQTTTGFSSFDMTTLDPLAKIVAIFSMAIGGEVGSTAGGFKILRFMILLKLMHFSLKRPAMAEHAVYDAQLANNTITVEEISRVLTLLGWFIALIIGSWLPFIALGFPPLDALFEVVSATATVGLSSGITQTSLQPLLKLVLCFDMLAGRLEIIALVVCLYPNTWLGRRLEK